MKFLNQIKKLLRKEDDKVKFEKIAGEWLEYKKNEVKESTYCNYLFIVKKYLNPEFAKKAMEEIQNYNYYVQKLLKNLAPKTVRDIINVLKAILKFYEDEYDCILQIKRISVPKLGKKKVRILNDKERRTLENYCIKQNTLKNIRYYSLFKYRYESWRNMCIKMEEY